MLLSQRAHAKRSFAALRALDPEVEARAELEAAGVSSTRIEALYPDFGFAALAPRLGQLFEGKSSPSSFFETHGWRSINSRLSALVPSAVPEDFVPWTHTPYAFADSKDFSAFFCLVGCIESALAREGSNLLERVEADGDDPAHHLAYELADACWLTWRTMTHYVDLPRREGKLADKLVIALADVLRLR